MGAAGLDIVDVSDPFHPQRAGHYRGPALDVAVCGTYLCIRNDDLQLIDISDLSQPKVVGTYAPAEDSGPPAGIGRSFAFRARTLFASYGDHCEIVDWSNPAQPTLLAMVRADDFTLQDQYLYVVAGADLSIWDVSQPENPVHAGTFTSLEGGLGTVAVDGHYAFVSEVGRGELHRWQDIMILDISNPAQPLLVGRSRLMARDLLPVFGRSFFKGGLLFSAQAELGLVVRALPGSLAMLQPPEAEGVLAGDPAELSVLSKRTLALVFPSFHDRSHSWSDWSQRTHRYLEFA
jgi:hypothetical protein